VRGPFGTFYTSLFTAPTRWPREDRRPNTYPARRCSTRSRIHSTAASIGVLRPVPSVRGKPGLPRVVVTLPAGETQLGPVLQNVAAWNPTHNIAFSAYVTEFRREHWRTKPTQPEITMPLARFAEPGLTLFSPTELAHVRHRGAWQHQSRTNCPAPAVHHRWDPDPTPST